MTIELPLPDRILSPNTRSHWTKKAKATKRARQQAFAYTLVEIGMETGLTFTGYKLAFFWPDKRRRDDDNAIASIKAYKDGIAEALKIDDFNLRMVEVPTFQIDRNNPRVEITLV